MPVTFDTHRLISRLIQGEMTEAQAQAVSDALQQALESTISQLATQHDLSTAQQILQKDITTASQALQQEISHLGSRITLLQWVVGIGYSLLVGVMLLNLNWTWQLVQRLPKP